MQNTRIIHYNARPTVLFYSIEVVPDSFVNHFGEHEREDFSAPGPLDRSLDSIDHHLPTDCLIDRMTAPRRIIRVDEVIISLCKRIMPLWCKWIALFLNEVNNAA